MEVLVDAEEANSATDIVQSFSQQKFLPEQKTASINMQLESVKAVSSVKV